MRLRLLKIFVFYMHWSRFMTSLLDSNQSIILPILHGIYARKPNNFWQACKDHKEIIIWVWYGFVLNTSREALQGNGAIVISLFWCLKRFIVNRHKSMQHHRYGRCKPGFNISMSKWYICISYRYVHIFVLCLLRKYSVLSW